jgi:hypothetical protein
LPTETTRRFASCSISSRATEQTLIILSLIAVTATITFAIADNPDLIPNFLMGIPLAAAVVVGAATGSPFGEAERTASQPLPTLRASTSHSCSSAAGSGSPSRASRRPTAPSERSSGTKQDSPV